MLRSLRIACLAVFALPAVALAQADDTTAPAATCVQPVVPPANKTLNKAAADKLNAESTAYAACGDAYLKARRATAAKYQAIANTHVDAANGFATQFNGFAATLDAYSKAQAAKAAKAKADE